MKRLKCGTIVTSYHNYDTWRGVIVREFGDGHQIWADVKVTLCYDKRGLGRIITRPLKELVEA